MLDWARRRVCAGGDASFAPLLICLRIVFVVQCFGMLRVTLSGGTALTTTMFMDWGWNSSFAYSLEIGGAYLLVFLACWTALTGSRIGAVYGTVWFFTLAAMATWQGGSFLSDWTVPAHATRIGLAAALLVPPRRIEWVLRLSIAATFATHGIEAIAQHPRFVDFLIRAGDVFAGVRISESATYPVLVGIGVVDIAVAALLLTGARWRWVVAYMAVWGTATALMRTVNIGPTGLGQTLIRAANGGLPLALLIHWQTSRKHHVHEPSATQELSPA